MASKKPPQTPQPLAGVNTQALQQAIVALQSGRLQEAEWLAADVLKRSPAEARALQIFGYALLRQGKAEDALAPLAQAARSTHDPEIETQYAMALQQAGRSEEALERLERALKRRPPFPPAFLVYGSLLAFLERRDEAIAVIKRGLTLTPNAPDLLALLADNLMIRGDRAGGLAAYRKALAQAPQYGDALFGLGRALQSEGDFAQAAEMFRRMLAIDPGDAAARIGLGVCLLEISQPAAAFESLRTASSSSAKAYGEALTALSTSRDGRFWLRPSDADRFLRKEKP